MLVSVGRSLHQHNLYNPPAKVCESRPHFTTDPLAHPYILASIHRQCQDLVAATRVLDQVQVGIKQILPLDTVHQTCSSTCTCPVLFIRIWTLQDKITCFNRKYCCVGTRRVPTTPSTACIGLPTQAARCLLASTCCCHQRPQALSAEKNSYLLSNYQHIPSKQNIVSFVER